MEFPQVEIIVNPDKIKRKIKLLSSRESNI